MSAPNSGEGVPFDEVWPSAHSPHTTRIASSKWRAGSIVT